METNKYYTPSIGEFHVGFEYYVQQLEELYGEPTYSDEYNIEISDGTDIKNFVFRGIPKNVKVKYLDAEDIESLGFVKINNMFRLGDYNTFIDMATGARIISFDAKLRTPNSDGTFKQYIIFKGFIKNKSELKKILEMLNIKHD